MQNGQARGLKFTESLLLALPFIALLLACALTSGKFTLAHGMPQVEMSLGFWWPVIFCTYVYGLLLHNLNDKRKENWRLRELIASIVALAFLWHMMAPLYEISMDRAERHKLPNAHRVP